MVTVISLQPLAGRHHPVLYDVYLEMKLLKNNLSEHESYWSSKLLISLQEMAAHKTNSVLQVLADVEYLESERHYPESGLVFADKHWRAFYHCHESVSKHPNEHGHFHIFTDVGDLDWAHVAGLSIDIEGQPLQWFMVNRWVTDGPWLKADNFFKQLAFVTAGDESVSNESVHYENTGDKNTCLVTNWMSALLQLYGDTLYELLFKRNAAIASHLNSQCRAEVFEDREIYTLATKDIDLQLKLENSLLHNYTKTEQQIQRDKSVERAV